MTRDIDIVVELAAADARRLHKLFFPDFYIDEQDIQEAVAGHGLFNIIHNATIVKIDFIVRKETAYRKMEFDRRRPIAVEGVEIMAVAPEDLMGLHDALGSPARRCRTAGKNEEVMNDTGGAAQKRWRELLRAKPPSQRLAMGCAMFDDAKKLALAGLRARNPNKTEHELKRLLFLRLYGPDFPQEKRDKIMAFLGFSRIIDGLDD